MMEMVLDEIEEYVECAVEEYVGCVAEEYVEYGVAVARGLKLN